MQDKIYYFLTNRRNTGCLAELFYGELQKISKIELPSIGNRELTWSVLVEKWIWGTVGEMLRKQMEKVNVL